jgi:hypothetical protein
MVDLTFESRAQNFVPLTLLRFIADSSSASPPTGFEYLGDGGVSAIKGTSSVRLFSAVSDIGRNGPRY